MLSPASAPSSIMVPSTDLLTFAFESSNSYDESKPIYIDAEDSTRSLNALQTKLLVRRLIAGLRAAGLKPGDCVLVILANNFLYSAIYFSIIGAGGVYLGVNPASQTFEINHILQLAEPKFIITSNDLLPSILRASEAQSPLQDHVFVVDSKTFPLSVASTLPQSPSFEKHESSISEKPKRYTEFIGLTHHGSSDWIRFSDEATARSTPAAFFSTSGTSGLPKAAILSHYAMISQHLSLEYHPPYEVSRLISLPFFHVFAALFTHVFPIRQGQPLYVLPRFQMEQFVAAVHRFQITDTVMAPPIVHALNRSSLSIREAFNTIRWIGVGGAPIAAEAMQKLRALLPMASTLSQVWGMTEIGAAMLVRYPEQGCDGSIGRPLPGYEMRLVDSFGGLVLAEDEPGELQVRYDGMMTGYKGQSAHKRGEWYFTGDIMTRSDGKYFVVGRSKELIKVNGWQVAPAELEAVLLSHPCVEDVGVIGVLGDNGDTELPRAYIVRKSDSGGRCSTTSAEEIYNFARPRLASYKALNGGIYFVDYIPKTASGKIQRFKLAQMDQYRRSVTDLLVKNNSVVAERKMTNITDLKVRAEERRSRGRRSSQTPSSQSCSQGATVSMRLSRFAIAKPRRKSRVSLVDKMKALNASQMAVEGDHRILSPTA